MNEPLDFCRVKKIDAKGFGFLKSLYYPNDIFFHFSQIKNEEFTEKLNEMKRGQFFLYFISKPRPDFKRKVDNLWYSLNDTPPQLHSAFLEKIIHEFNDGSTNIYDLLFVFSEMKKCGIIDPPLTERIISSKRIHSLPTTIVPFLSEQEIKLLKEKLNLKEISKSPSPPFWYDEISRL